MTTQETLWSLGSGFAGEPVHLQFSFFPRGEISNLLLQSLQGKILTCLLGTGWRIRCGSLYEAGTPWPSELISGLRIQEPRASFREGRRRGVISDINKLVGFGRESLSLRQLRLATP